MFCKLLRSSYNPDIILHQNGVTSNPAIKEILGAEYSPRATARGRLEQEGKRHSPASRVAYPSAGERRLVPYWKPRRLDAERMEGESGETSMLPALFEISTHPESPYVAGPDTPAAASDPARWGRAGQSGE